MPGPLSPEAESSALEMQDMMEKQERSEKLKTKPDEQKPSFSLRERLFRTLEEITTPRGT